MDAVSQKHLLNEMLYLPFTEWFNVLRWQANYNEASITSIKKIMYSIDKRNMVNLDPKPEGE